MVLRRRLASIVVACAALTACVGDDATSTDATTSGGAATATTTTPTAAPASTVGTTAPSTSPTTSTSTSTSTSTTTTAPPAPPTTTFPAVEAAAYAVFDMRTGTFLAANQPDVPLPVGSLIKLLTAQTAYAAGQPTKVVVAPDGLIVDPEESRIGISPGQELPRDLLVRALLIVSANDAARALALDIAGGEQQFAELMNQQAAALGLSATQAVNPTGLDAEGQHSSAGDLTRLAAFLMGNPTFQLTVERTDAMLNGQTFPSTNDLLSKYPGADGVKTGHTTQAGWCVVASATRNGRRIIATVLGAPTEEARDAAATSLLDWGFTQP